MISDTIKSIDWKQIFVLLAIAIFVFELFAFGVVGNPLAGVQAAQRNATPVSVVTGIAHATVAITDYEPYLVLTPTSLSEGTLQQIRRHPDVEDVRMVQGQYIVSVVRREKLEGIFQDLKTQNLGPQLIAFVTFPSFLEVNTSEGPKDFASPDVTIKQSLAFYLPIGESANATIGVTGQGQQLQALTSFEFNQEPVSFTANATVLRQTYEAMVFGYAWEDRNSVNLSANTSNGWQGWEGNHSTTYARKDYVDLRRNLTDAEMAQIDVLGYVTHVSRNRVSVEPGFTNRTQIERDIDVPMLFPPSVYSVPVSNEAVVDDPGPDRYLLYTYQISLQIPEGYRWSGGDTELTVREEKTVNQTLTVQVGAETIGKTIVQVNGVSG